MKKKIIKKVKKKHRHRWESDGDSCMACGAYEAYCKGCETIGLFSGEGKLLDTAN